MGNERFDYRNQQPVTDADWTDVRTLAREKKFALPDFETLRRWGVFVPVEGEQGCQWQRPNIQK